MQVFSWLPLKLFIQILLFITIHLGKLWFTTLLLDQTCVKCVVVTVMIIKTTIHYVCITCDVWERLKLEITEYYYYYDMNAFIYRRLILIVKHKQYIKIFIFSINYIWFYDIVNYNIVYKVILFSFLANHSWYINITRGLPAPTKCIFNSLHMISVFQTAKIRSSYVKN